MPTFMMSMNFTDQGIRGIKDAPKRAEAARDLAKKLGVEVAKFALVLGSLGNVRTRTCRVWPAEEYVKLVSELP